jgi:hypothetical protein
MRTRSKVLAAFVAVATTALVAAVTSDAMAGGRGSGPVVYVTSQSLFYDSIVLTDLPRQGPFQLLEMGGPSPDGLFTEYGPGNPGYLGGRWWVDVNGDGEMDDEDNFFMCPLLPPGREEP